MARNLNNIFIRSSSLYKCMVGTIGASESELARLEDYDRRLTTFQELTDKQVKDLRALDQIPDKTEVQQREYDKMMKKKSTLIGITPKMQEDYDKIKEKINNPILPQTTRTQIDEIVIEIMYDMEKDISNKYMLHGIACEPFAIDMINMNLGTNMSKYEGRVLRSKKHHVSGLPDIWEKDKVVIEIKNPYDVFSFNKKRADIDPAYWWQCQAYMWLTGERVSYIVFTLNENIYMEGTEYEDLAFLDRVICKRIDYDPEAEQEYLKRLPLILDYISESKDIILDNIETTSENLVELRDILSVS